MDGGSHGKKREAFYFDLIFRFYIHGTVHLSMTSSNNQRDAA